MAGTKMLFLNSKCNMTRTCFYWTGRGLQRVIAAPEEYLKMSIIITDDCINCSACEAECPVNAVYPKLNCEGRKEDLFINNKALETGFASGDHYFVNPYLCNGCKGIFDEPRCNSVCPVSCCLSENEYYGTTVKGVKVKVDPAKITKISLN
jgi:ferredoxin